MAFNISDIFLALIPYLLLAFSAYFIDPVEGANYYVSWKDHGVYLFHSVPTKASGAYNVEEAEKLGKSTGSHGCIRLSIPDAKWMSANLPVGTKIVIEN